MMYRHHISRASAAAIVDGPEIIVAMTHAGIAKDSAVRLEYLSEALTLAKGIVADIEAAVAAESSSLKAVS